MRLSLAVLLACAAAVPALAQGALGLDTLAMDRTVRPQDDLFRYVNGRWLETTPIPADRSRYGAFDLLREAAETNLRAIAEDAAAGRVDDPDAAKIGAYFTAYMDTARVEALGVAPLQPDLDRIDAVASTADLARYFAGTPASFGPSPVRASVSVDDRNSDRHVFFVNQSGLGLPDRGYYFDDSFADARAAYGEYLTTLYDLAGWPGGAEAAQTVLDLETKLAQDQWTRVQNRDPEATYNMTAVGDLVSAHPHLHLDTFLRERGAWGRVDSGFS